MSRVEKEKGEGKKGEEEKEEGKRRKKRGTWK